MTMGMGTWATKVVATVVVATDGTGDTTDIQTGINLLPAGGGVVYVREGTYTITNRIEISANVSIIGAGYSTHIIAGAGVNRVIYNPVASNNLTLEKVRIDGNSIAVTGIYLDSADGSIIRDCWIENCTTQGIYVTSISGNIVNNIISACGDGIWANFTLGLKIIGNRIIDCTGNGIAATNQFIGNTGEGIISNNVIKDNGGDGITTSAAVGATIRYLAINSNVVLDNGGTGIVLEVRTLSSIVDSNVAVGNTTAQITNNGGITNVIGDNVTA